MEPGLVISVRSFGVGGRTIRGTLGSFTNHNALSVFDHPSERFKIAEAVMPVSKLTELAEYEHKMNLPKTHRDYIIVRIWRVKGLTTAEKFAISEYARCKLMGIPYPINSVLRMWVFRFVNSLPWEIEGKWCSQLDADAIQHVKPNALLDPRGKIKKNFTPRTFENRLVSGAIEDATDEIIVNVDRI